MSTVVGVSQLGVAPRGGADRRLQRLLLVLSANMLVDALEVSTTIVAMPTIARSFGLSQRMSSSLVVAFALGFGGFAIASQRLAVRHGRRPAYLVAMAVFAVASVCAGLAPNLAVLLATRVVKGACVALTAPTGLAIIAATFPDGHARHRALATYSLFGACGFSAGLVVSGLLTTASWRWAMSWTAPVALALCLAASGLIPRDLTPRDLTPRDAARPTAVRLRRAIMRTSKSPASPRPRRWALGQASAGAAALNGSYWGFLFLTTFDFQSRRTFAPWWAGLALLPSSLPLALATPWCKHLLVKAGARRLIAAGAVSACAGYIWYAQRPSMGYGALVPALLLIAAAFVLSFTALNARAMSGLAPHEQASAGARFQTSVQLGGVAVLIAVAAAPHRLGPWVVVVAATCGVAAAFAGVPSSSKEGRA